MPLVNELGSTAAAAAAAAATASSLFLPNSFPLSRLHIPRSEAIKASIRSPFPTTPASLRELILRSNLPKPRKFPPPSCFPSISNTESSPKLGLLMEVDGVLADVYRQGSRQAFNVAFQKLGLDCANWTEPIYADLRRKAAGDEDRMLMLFFNRIGWPTSLPTSEKETFMKGIMREKKNALKDLTMSSSLALRPGIENFIDDAIKEGISLVLLTAYCKIGDEVCRSIIDKLGYDRLLKVEVIGKEEVKGSYYGQVVLGKGVTSSLDEQLAKEARKAVSMEKRRVAVEVSSILKLSVDIDTSSSESTDMVVATLRAGAEYARLPVQDCVLIAGSQSGVSAAERIGMPSVVIRNSATARAEFRSAKAVMDGFGGADLSISKLLKRFTHPT